MQYKTKRAFVLYCMVVFMAQSNSIFFTQLLFPISHPPDPLWFDAVVSRVMRKFVFGHW